ncbi:helicase associated domain-containing protein [Streptomyces sp. NPDC056053]|uniref:helicase associated domain-containing protein n=2 Tax=unclassified Streptomyces TaxID=2593676 RepID=UPI0035DC81DD
MSAAAGSVLRFGEARDPVALASFVRLRVIDPEGAYWRRGVEAAARWRRETGNTALRVSYAYETPVGWGSVGGYPLGRWLASQRTAYAAGTLEAGRVVELEGLGMVWSEREAAWADGLMVARLYAEAHGHLLPPVTAVWGEYPIGEWVKNQRAAARRAAANDELRAAGQPVVSSAGAMTRARQDELDAVDPGWCPAWEATWQRRLRLVQAHVRAGGRSRPRPGRWWSRARTWGVGWLRSGTRKGGGWCPRSRCCWRTWESNRPERTSGWRGGGTTPNGRSAWRRRGLSTPVRGT